MNFLNYLDYLDGSTLFVANMITAILLAICVFSHIRSRRIAIESENRNAELIKHLSEGIYQATLDGKHLSANPALARIHGYETGTDLISHSDTVGSRWYVEQGRSREFRALLFSKGRVDDFVSEIYREKTGERAWIIETARLVHHRKSGRLSHYEGSIRDITETVRRQEVENRLRKLSDRLPGVLFQLTQVASTPLRISYLSAGIDKIPGLKGQDFGAGIKYFLRNLSPSDRRRCIADFRQAKTNMTLFDLETCIGSPQDGQWIRIVAQPGRMEQKLHWYGYITDISAAKRQALEIESLVYLDPLTGLDNRRRFFDVIPEHVTMASHHAPGTLLYIDLDQFKSLNDTHGHSSGDFCLRAVADALRNVSLPGDVAARIGGDEFVLALANSGLDRVAATQIAVQRAQRFLAHLRDGFDFEGYRLTLMASVGIVTFDGSEADMDMILRRADMAMYRAKDAGEDGISVYDEWVEDFSSQGHQPDQSNIQAVVIGNRRLRLRRAC